MKPGTSPSSGRGMSLPELLIAVSIVAILTVVAIPSYMSYYGSSQAAFATNVLERTNSAVHQFNEANYELNVSTTGNTGAAVELSVIRTLQYRNPLNPKPGTPYVGARWNPVASSSTADYRLQWVGTLFTLLAPGTAGTGLKINFGGADMGTPYTYPANYTMAGS